MKVSVIVPVYNAGNRLRECVDSILRQSCTDAEILLIDDGSTDGSGQICDAYASEHPRVLVVHQENCGAGAARNEGLRRAAGEWILFADADDYLPDGGALAKLIDRAESADCDIAVGSHARLWDGRYMDTVGHRHYAHLRQNDPRFRFAGFFSAGNLSYVWGKAYRRSFLETHGIRFGAYSYAEDKVFNILCYAAGARYSFLEDVIYIYRKNSESISQRYRSDSVGNWLQIAGDMHRHLESGGMLPGCADLVALTIAFAAFFDGKMQYCKYDRRVAPVTGLLRSYAADEAARMYMTRLSRGEYMAGVWPWPWRVLLRGFAAGMHVDAYGLLALGIKLLVDLRIDERLSDTGRRRG